MEELKFDDLPESKETRYVKEPGIHLGFKIQNIEWTDEKVKEVKGQAPKTVNAYVKVTLADDAGETFIAFLFAPPVKAEDVKFTGDVYEKGIKIRKRTPEEQIRVEFDERYYFYEQLAKAIKAIPEKRAAFKKQIAGPVDTMFRRMYDRFTTIFPKESYADKKINFKSMWKNDKKAQTSNLTLCRAEDRNVVFAPFIDAKTPVLQLSSWEEENQVRMFKPQDRKPTTDKADAGPANDTDKDWKPLVGADEPDLF